jgi:hypothetical protein
MYQRHFMQNKDTTAVYRGTVALRLPAFNLFLAHALERCSQTENRKGRNETVGLKSTAFNRFEIYFYKLLYLQFRGALRREDS